MSWAKRLLLCVFGLPLGAVADCSNTVPLQLSDSIVMISSEDGTLGSGVVVAPNRVLTVAHAVRSVGGLQVSLLGQLVPAHPVSFSLSDDLALLALDTKGVASVPLGQQNLSPEQHIWVSGHPQGGPAQFAYGRVVGPWRNSLRVTALIEQGQSGGALLACEGAKVVLAGTLSGYAALDNGGEPARIPNFSLVVPLERIKAFMVSVGL